MKRAVYNTTKEMLINATLPLETRTYKPILHEQLMDLTLNSIQVAGFQLDKELYTGTPDGQIANGRFTISNVKDNDMQLEIGWQNSYNKTLSLKFAIGGRVFICANGCVSGDMGAFKKKHRGTIQEFTPTAITDYIKEAGEVFQKMVKEKEAMKQIEITKRTKAELIGRMVLEEQIISSMQMNMIAKEIEAPTHDYGAPDSMWELYNYTTFAMKGLHPMVWMSDHIKAHRFFVNESGLLTPSEQVLVTMPTSPVEEESPFVQLGMFDGEAE